MRFSILQVSPLKTFMGLSTINWGWPILWANWGWFFFFFFFGAGLVVFGVFCFVCGCCCCWFLDHLRACFENSSINSSRSLFLGILPTNSRWLLNDIVTPIFLPVRISKSFSCNCLKVHTKQKKILICYEKFVIHWYCDLILDWFGIGLVVSKVEEWVFVFDSNSHVWGV